MRTNTIIGFSVALFLIVNGFYKIRKDKSRYGLWMVIIGAVVLLLGLLYLRQGQPNPNLFPSF